jgi:CheY-like chemotaxis protein
MTLLESNSHREQRAEASQVPSERAKVRPSILVVEDEPLIRMALSDFLQDRGFKVFEAASAGEAMRFLCYGDTDVSLIFSDIQLGPGCNGIDLAVWSKVHYPDIRVALTSGNPKYIEDARAHEEPAAVFSKPYDFLKLSHALHALIAAGNDP